MSKSNCVLQNDMLKQDLKGDIKMAKNIYLIETKKGLLQLTDYCKLRNMNYNTILSRIWRHDTISLIPGIVVMNPKIPPFTDIFK